jgi:hypothetical protein
VLFEHLTPGHAYSIRLGQTSMHCAELIPYYSLNFLFELNDSYFKGFGQTLSSLSQKKNTNYLSETE